MKIIIPKAFHKEIIEPILTRTSYQAPFPWKTVYLIGGRNSAKTFSAIYLAILMLIQIKTKAIFLRYYNKDTDKIFEDVENILIKEKLIDYFIIWRGNRKIFRYKGNGSEIEIIGLFTTSNEKIKLTGLSSLFRYQYALILWDEAQEYPEKVVLEVKEAVRGACYTLHIFTSNPWDKNHHLIDYCHRHLPFNRNKLLTKPFYMTKTYQDEFFHYSNYRINPFLEIDKINEIESLKNIYPARYEIVSVGMPGILEGLIFKNLNLVGLECTTNNTRWVGGLDYGYVKDAMAALIIGLTPLYQTVNVLDEYYHWNERMVYKNLNQMAKEIVDFYKDFLELNKIVIKKQGQLVVYCDSSEQAFIQMLNNQTRQTNFYEAPLSYFLKFKPCQKIKVIHHVNYLETLISSKRLNINKECINLWHELESARWKETGIEKIVDDGLNHAWDALIYALIPYWINISENMKGSLKLLNLNATLIR